MPNDDGPGHGRRWWLMPAVAGLVVLSTSIVSMAQFGQPVRMPATKGAAAVPSPVAGPERPVQGSDPELQPGHVFRDCAECPEMVVVPSGRFTMGWNERFLRKPAHTVIIAKHLAVGKFEVTFAEWDACFAAKGCTHEAYDPAWERGRLPVVNVSWDDAKEYVAWLSKTTGKTYRLLSEAEWEYAARAGTTSHFPWGDEASHDFANYGNDKCCTSFVAGRDLWLGTAPVGQFPANPFGLHDMHGNVREWVEDSWHENYEGAPSDGSAWPGGDTKQRVLRDGDYTSDPDGITSDARIGSTLDSRRNAIGFRVARTLF